MSAEHAIQAGDVISIAGIFRDGVMDEARKADTDNVQHWRALCDGGSLLHPVLATGEPDRASYWFGRETGIAVEHGRYGVISKVRR